VVAGVLVLGGIAWWLVDRARHARQEEIAEVATATPLPGLGISAEATPVPTPPPTPTPSLAPTPTPTPRPSYIVVPAAWSGDVSVTVGKTRRRLDREQRFPVTPGTSTKVVFEYSGDYSDRVQNSVRVDEGETTRLTVPLAPPALLQVQQRVGTPMGRVMLDGADLGTPIVRRKAKPGTHQLRIEPASPGANAIDQQIELPAGRKLVLTFDLAAGRITQVLGDIPAP